MKNYLILSAIFLQIFTMVAIISGATFFFSESSFNKTKVRDSKTIAQESNELKFDKAEDKDNATYLVNVAEIHLQEIYLAQLVQQRAKQIDVKELGKMIERNNSKTFRDLTNLADKKSISIPASITTQGLQTAEFLTNKSGLSFDKEYCDMIVVSQKHFIKVLEEITEKSSDSEIKIWAFCALPAMRKHLEYALICQRKYGSI